MAIFQARLYLARLRSRREPPNRTDIPARQDEANAGLRRSRANMRYTDSDPYVHITIDFDSMTQVGEITRQIRRAAILT